MGAERSTVWVVATAIVGILLAAASVAFGKDTAPVVHSESAAGSQPVDLAAYQGKVVYLDFWASWCVPCRQSFPWMNSLQRQYGKDGLVIVAVNLDQVRADADDFLRKYPAEFTVRFQPEGALARRFNVRGMPTSALLGRDGKTLLVHEGFRSKDIDSLEQSIRSALH